MPILGPYKDRQYIYCPFNKSGIQDSAIRQILEISFIRNIDVWTADLLDHDYAQTFHLKMNWEDALEYLKQLYEKDPIGIVCNPLCSFNTYLCPSNFPRLGWETIPKEVERFEKKKEWMKICKKILHSGTEIVYLENPAGFMDNVITLSSGKPGYDKLQPWMFFDPANPNVEDKHNKETHIWNGGCKDAIRAFPLTKKIISKTMPMGTTTNWVMEQEDSDARSKFAPGFAKAIALNLVERLMFLFRVENGLVKMDSDGDPIFKKNVQTKMRKFEWHSQNIHKDKREACGRGLGYDNNRIARFCNLPKGHDTERECKRGVACICGIYDYANGEYVHKEIDFSWVRPTPNSPTLTVKPSPKHKSRIPKPITKKKRKVYTCRKCGQPKKGHICRMVTMETCTPCKPTVYKCGKCGQPKKGHVCRFAF